MKTGVLKVEATDGTKIDVVWPPCGEEILGNAVNFQIGRKSTTFAINSLPARVIESNGCLELFEEHRLSSETVQRVLEWLGTAEVSPNAIKFP